MMRLLALVFAAFLSVGLAHSQPAVQVNSYTSPTATAGDSTNRNATTSFVTSGIATAVAGQNAVLPVNAKLKGAIGDGVADDTAALQAAINATPAAGALYIPAGNYKLIGSGSCILTVTQSITVYGDGYGTSLFLDATVPNTRDVICVVPSISSAGYTFRDFAIKPFSGGRHGLQFDATTSPLIYNVLVQKMLILPTAGGNSIHSSGANSALANSTIRNNNLESINLPNAGDGLTISENVIGGANNGIYIADVAGATGTVIEKNVFAGTAAHIIIDAGATPIIRDNEFESPINITNTYGFLIDLKGSVSGLLAPQLTGNQFSVLTGTGNPIPIRVQAASLTSIRGGGINNQSGAHIKIEATASNTWLDSAIQCRVAGTPAACSITDAGASTSFMPTFGAGTSNQVPYFSATTALTASGADFTWTPSSGILLGKFVKTTPVTVSGLPTCNAGAEGTRAYVTDQNTAVAYRGAVTGGGATRQAVLCSNSAWIQD